MKIAMLGAKAVPAIGGIAHYIEELGTRLVAQGHEVAVYCRPHYLEGGEESYRGMRRIVTRGVRGKHLDAATHTLSAALHAWREPFDILHVHGCGPGAVAPLLRLQRPARVVVTIHGLDWQRSKWGGVAARAMYLGAKLGATGAHRLTAVSQWVCEQHKQLVGVEPLFIPTGVTLSDAMPAQELFGLGLQPQEFILCAARLVPEKGVHYLLDAFAQLDTDKKLVIAGNCPYDDPYVQQLRAKANDRVIFAGYVQGRLLAELYSNAYLYVQPSELEGLSISVLEALSHGRYVLASDIPENREALGPCGGTFRSQDVADLRDRLAELLGQAGLVEQEFGKARRFISKDRNWDTTAAHFASLYSELASSSAAAPAFA